jgi:hypothetical protein
VTRDLGFSESKVFCLNLFAMLTSCWFRIEKTDGKNLDDRVITGVSRVTGVTHVTCVTPVTPVTGVTLVTSVTV